MFLLSAHDYASLRKTRTGAQERRYTQVYFQSGCKAGLFSRPAKKQVLFCHYFRSQALAPGFGRNCQIPLKLLRSQALKGRILLQLLEFAT